jgi:very-short-patch-repair endonuclease
MRAGALRANRGSGNIQASRRDLHAAQLCDWTGHRDQRAFASRPVRLDMVFQAPNGRVLVVEYDGAYWHRGQEERDFRKARLVEDAWWDRGCVVVRIREDPLTPLYSPDLQVPARRDAITYTRLMLLHLLHVMPGDFDGHYEEGEVYSFLRSTRRPLERSDVRCEICQHVASKILPAEIFPRAAPQVKRKRATTLPIA